MRRGRGYRGGRGGPQQWRGGSKVGRGVATTSRPPAVSPSEEPSAATLARVAAIERSREKHLEAMSDSGSEEAEDEEEEKMKQLLKNTLKAYYRDLDNPENDEDNEFAESRSMLMAAGSCLVCLSAIRRVEATWSCVRCFCLFHLQCIQQWARDGVKQLSLLSPELFPGRELSWSCPKCRHDYRHSAFPEKYVCFCGKEVDPPVDLWLLPHSCGQICDKPLQPECGHRCVALCHPGLCPPCPKTVNIHCFCGRSQPVVKRCGAGGWSCGEVCGRELSCDLHTCEDSCHEGPCPPCQQKMEQSCECGKESQLRLCGGEDWQCQQQCGKMFSCGHHQCQQVCHSGLCGQCPRSGVRACPCGKTEHTLPCTEDVPTCGDTCNKELTCGQHQCSRQCHYGDCGQCLQLAVKRCRCGKKEKSILCSEKFQCESRCQKMRQCGRHQCRKRCCDGNCPPCDQVCGRGLGCRNHKCVAPCHAGRCYPCVQTVDISCHCGTTKVIVPCGREKDTKPPKCRAPCQIPPACHHTARKPHHCHYGPCPPCRLRCNRPLSCGHSCLASCHSEPKTPKIVRPPGTAPWVKVAPSSLQPVVEPCPPCRQPVSMACKGNHEISQFLCSELREHSCGRKCGRKLACGNHRCERGCHEVINPPGDQLAGEDCLPCERECQKPRPDGCTHPCPLPCHQDNCPQCPTLVKLQCHCSTMKLYVKCCEWTAASEEKRVELQTCTSQCTHTLTCGHRCPQQCHAGECPREEECRKRVVLRCPCRRIKKDARCNERLHKSPSCDEECERIKREKEEEKQREAEAKREAEEREAREREEALERALRPRKKKRKRRAEVEEEEPSLYQRHRTAVLVTMGIVIVVVLVVVGLTASGHLGWQ